MFDFKLDGVKRGQWTVESEESAVSSEQWAVWAGIEVGSRLY